MYGCWSEIVGRHCKFAPSFGFAEMLAESARITTPSWGACPYCPLIVRGWGPGRPLFLDKVRQRQGQAAAKPLQFRHADPRLL
jgi:hypothetical protein